MEMEIDIISYTELQYSELTEEQLMEVRSAQMKKNKLTEKLEKDLEKQKYRLIENGTYRSSIWENVQWELNNAYEMEVENIRNALLFYLQFALKEEGDADSREYVVDYSLPMEDRYLSVKTYYEATYMDLAERFEEFEMDKVARRYLGEYYAPLYDYFLENAYE